MGIGKLTGVLCSAIEMLLRGRMRGYNELKPTHREQVEACSQGDQEPTFLLPPVGAGMGAPTGVAIHKEGGRLGRGVF